MRVRKMKLPICKCVDATGMVMQAMVYQYHEARHRKCKTTIKMTNEESGQDNKDNPTDSGVQIELWQG